MLELLQAGDWYARRFRATKHYENISFVLYTLSSQNETNIVVTRYEKREHQSGVETGWAAKK